MIARLLLAVTALAGMQVPTAAQEYSRPPITVAPPPVTRVVHGPRDFCAELFSVRLEEGESIQWTEGSVAPYGYIIWSGGHSIDIGPSVGDLPGPQPARPVVLPLSPVAERYARRLVGAPSRFGVHYLLHGVARRENPVDIFASSTDENVELPVAARVDPRSIEERGCTSGWRDKEPAK